MFFLDFLNLSQFFWRFYVFSFNLFVFLFSCFFLVLVLLSAHLARLRSVIRVGFSLNQPTGPIWFSGCDVRLYVSPISQLVTRQQLTWILKLLFISLSKKGALKSLFFGHLCPGSPWQMTKSSNPLLAKAEFLFSQFVLSFIPTIKGKRVIQLLTNQTADILEVFFFARSKLQF